MSARQIVALVSLSIGFLACKSDSGSGEGQKPSGAVCPSDSKLTYQDDIQPLMTKYCTTCHATSVTGAARHDAPDDHNFETEAGIVSEAHHIDLDAASGPDSTNTTMPPSGYPAPTTAERAKIGEWLACNADVATDDDD